MNYTAALSDFFKSPKWLNNLLLGGVCMLIPIIGPLVLMGWHVTVFWGRKETDKSPGFPDFDFSNTGKYLQRGIWPFLASLVPTLVLAPVMSLMMIMFIGSVVTTQTGNAHGQHSVDGFPIAMFAVLGVVGLVIFFLTALLTHPLRVAGALAQDFAPIFNWRRMKQFIALTWLEIVVSMVFLWGVGFFLALAGMMALFVGVYFAISITLFMSVHLDYQLYQLYLQRGGEPIPASSKLYDGPPPLPPSLPIPS